VSPVKYELGSYIPEDGFLLEMTCLPLARNNHPISGYRRRHKRWNYSRRLRLQFGGC
jgi:hypothetical protein